MKLIITLYFSFLFSAQSMGQKLNIFYIDNYKVHPGYFLKNKVDSIMKNKNDGDKMLIYYSNELQPIVLKSEKDTTGFWLLKRSLNPNSPTLSTDLDSLLCLLHEEGYQSLQEYFFISEASLKVNQQYTKSLIDRLNLVLYGATENAKIKPKIFIMPAELKIHKINLIEWSKAQSTNYEIIPYAAKFY